jgi:myosin heavy subunit
VQDTGLLAILDQETLSGGSSGSFLSKITAVQKTNPFLELVKDGPETSFIIKHHDGPITYSSTDFIGANLLEVVFQLII